MQFVTVSERSPGTMQPRIEPHPAEWDAHGSGPRRTVQIHPASEEGGRVVTAGVRSTRGVQRSARATAKLAWLLCGLALALLAAALLVLLIGRPSATSATDPWHRCVGALMLLVVGAPPG